MSESPPPPDDDTGGPGPDDGDRTIEKKRGESDPLFNSPPGLKRRNTFMGLAPAPHLGGLSGSPGATARAEAEARKKRIAAAASSRPAALGEPRQSRYTGPPPPPTPSPITDPMPRDKVPVYTGPPPPEPNFADPAVGGTTLLMTADQLRPQTPLVPLTLPISSQRPGSLERELPPSDGWEVAAELVDPNEGRGIKESSPGMESAPTILIDPAQRAARLQAEQQAQQQQQQQQQRNTPRYGRQRSEPPPSRYGRNPHPTPVTHVVDVIEEARHTPAPTTARMLRTATPADPINNASIPTSSAALAIRGWEPSGGPQHAMSGPLDKRLILLNEPDSPRAASFRVLRDSLLGRNMPRVVAVSSASHRDGKTTCAINLALALAEQGSTKVLLLDANFFDPELAKIFHIERLTPVIDPSEAWLAPYTVVAVTGTLHVAGILPPSASGSMAPGQRNNRRFEQHRFEQQIDRLCRDVYDYLIIDAPSLHNNSPTVQSMLGGVDGTVLAVRTGGTTGRDLKKASQQIPANKALGIALIET